MRNPTSLPLLILSSLSALSSFSNAATLSALWEFDNAANIGKATVGSDLTVTGAAPTHNATLSDGSTSLAGVITTVGGTANYLRAAHGIAPNGGGTYVNEWSVLFDVFTPAASSSSWRSLFQTNLGNSNDADYFIRNTDDKLGVSGMGYSPNPINDSQWTRIVVTFNLGSTLPSDEIKTYVNGTLFHTHTDQAIDGTYGLDPAILFFADNNAENASLNVGTIAMFNGALTASEVTALGGVQVAVPEPSSIVIAGLGVLATTLRRSRRKTA